MASRGGGKMTTAYVITDERVRVGFSFRSLPFSQDVISPRQFTDLLEGICGLMALGTAVDFIERLEPDLSQAEVIFDSYIYWKVSAQVEGRIEYLHYGS